MGYHLDRTSTDNLQSKLSGWKTNFLNMAGRTTLVKSSLSHMETHVMQYIRLPCSISKAIDRIQRNFVWGTTDVRKKLHMIKWDIVIKDRNSGGLGVQISRTRNEALLTKLAWRLFKSPHDLWASLLLNKYTRSTDLFTHHRHLKTVSRSWKNITQG
ncbi:hypothetical protein R3W88_030032 [Solanum pinnatisectum]|uniref:Uncharacterized protein n=1 Tax=Solanum pinnatisectum TaxID=50273 RepID=A0AAV9KAI2_9SOLN|nr:hypothetical protein R3W88_030032 [Solanum pinnatisectum]